MRRWVALVGGSVCLAAVVLVGEVLGEGSAFGAPKPPVDHRAHNDVYLVAYRKSVADPDSQTSQLENTYNFRAKFRYHAAVKGFAAKLSPDQVEGVKGQPSVASVTPNKLVHALGNTVPLADGDAIPTGVQRMGAGDPNGGAVRPPSSAAVAVLDTGIRLGHQDLPNAQDGTNCISPGDPAVDNHGHGSHVAGTIAATNNGVGVVGVAPDTTVYAVKVLDDTGSGTFDQIICGIDWVAANSAALNIGVANLSLGCFACGTPADEQACGDPADSAFHEAICGATDPAGGGVIFAVAAGNNADPVGFEPVDLPAFYPEVLMVTAMSDSDGQPGGAGDPPGCARSERDDVVASFSSSAGTDLDSTHVLAGPGVCIKSAWFDAPDSYHTISGTSMATPHVAGAAALCLGESLPDGTAPPGPCSGLASNNPGPIIDQLVNTDPSYSFSGDRNNPIPGKDYGYLVSGAP